MLHNLPKSLCIYVAVGTHTSVVIISIMWMMVALIKLCGGQSEIIITSHTPFPRIIFISNDSEIDGNV